MFGLFLTKNYDMASDNLEYSARVICGPLLLYVGDNFYGVFWQQRMEKGSIYTLKMLLLNNMEKKL